jgi:hypothetical protein
MRNYKVGATVADQSFALKGQYIPARRIVAGSIAQEINAL